MSHDIHWDPAVRELVAREVAAAEARALRDAATNPAARLSGHSGVSVRWLLARADTIEAAR